MSVVLTSNYKQPFSKTAVNRRHPAFAGEGYKLVRAWHAADPTVDLITGESYNLGNAILKTTDSTNGERNKSGLASFGFGMVSGGGNLPIKAPRPLDELRGRPAASSLIVASSQTNFNSGSPVSLVRCEGLFTPYLVTGGAIRGGIWTVADGFVSLLPGDISMYLNVSNPVAIARTVKLTGGSQTRLFSRGIETFNDNIFGSGTIVTSGATNPLVYLGTEGNDELATTETLSLVLIWDGLVPEAYLRELSVNPWAILSPVASRSIFIGNGAASPPVAPTIGTTTSIGPTSATANWTDNSSDETSFEVERENPSGGNNWTSAGTTGANATSLNITGLTASTQYRLRVRAVNGAGPSAWSTGGTFTTSAPTSAPSPTITDPVSVVVDTVTVSGTISSTETPTATVSLAPQPSGTVIGPFSATIAGSAPNFTFSRAFTAVANNNYIATVVATNSGGSNSDPSLQFEVNSITGPGGGEVPTTSAQLSAAGSISLSGVANLNVSFTNLSATGVVALTSSAFLQVPVQLSSNGTIRLTGSANIPAVVALAANAQIRLTGTGTLENAVGGTLIGIGGGSIASLMEYNNVIGGFKIGEGTIVVILSKNGGIVKE